jgi:hypothetical protein
VDRRRYGCGLKKIRKSIEEDTEVFSALKYRHFWRLFFGMGRCKAAGVNFRDWTMYFLNNVHGYDNEYCKDLAELLPHNYKAQ